MDQNEMQWDRLLKIKTTGRVIRIRISIVIHMSRRNIVYWSGWHTVG